MTVKGRKEPSGNVLCLDSMTTVTWVPSGAELPEWETLKQMQCIYTEIVFNVVKIVLGPLH